MEEILWQGNTGGHARLVGKCGTHLSHVRSKSRKTNPPITAMFVLSVVIPPPNFKQNAMLRQISLKCHGCAGALSAVPQIIMKRLFKSLNVFAGRMAAGAIVYLWKERLGAWYNRKTGTYCRFHPSCSRYAVVALVRHGVWRGGVLTIQRLRRCNPANTETCIDFPPRRTP